MTKININIDDLNTIQTMELLRDTLDELILDYEDNRDTIDALAEDQVLLKTLSLLALKIDEFDEADAFGTEMMAKIWI